MDQVFLVTYEKLTTLSLYIQQLKKVYLTRTMSKALWNVAGALVRPKGILAKSNRPT